MHWWPRIKSDKLEFCKNDCTARFPNNTPAPRSLGWKSRHSLEGSDQTKSDTCGNFSYVTIGRLILAISTIECVHGNNPPCTQKICSFIVEANGR